MTDESIWSKAQPRGISRSLPRRKTGLASNTKKSYIKSKSHCLIFYQSIVGGLYTIISEGKFTQSYTFVCLDIFNNIIHNKDKKIENKLEEWLVFLSQDDPDMIMKLLDRNPEFQKIYEEIYTLCLNMEGMMEMFSKELEIMDRNTVKLMIDEMEEELNETKRKAKEELNETKRKAKKEVDEVKRKAKEEIEEAEKRAKAAEEETERLRRTLEEQKGKRDIS